MYMQHYGNKHLFILEPALMEHNTFGLLCLPRISPFNIIRKEFGV